MSTVTADGTENVMRWDRKSPGFLEAWYFTATHRRTGVGLWLRYTITSLIAGDPYCELWGFFFDPEGKRTFSGKARYGIDVLGSGPGRDDGALVRIGHAWLTENHLEGAIDNDERTLSWSLDFAPSDRCFQHLPPQVRSRVERRISTVCAPNLDVPVTGSVTLDGEILNFDGEPGHQGHRWGRRNSSTWAWTHCAVFEGSDDAVFEGVAARSGLGPIPIPTMTFLYLSLNGEDIAFNDLRGALRAKSRYELPTWAFTAHNDQYRIIGAARSSIDRIVQVRYTDPDGTLRHCANTEIGDLAIEVYRRDGALWRHSTSLTSLRGAHLEFGRREPFVELPVSV
jgi:Tocopherol cyclase